MARRPTSNAPDKPVHTLAEKQQDIVRIQRRIEELNGFDPNTVTTRFSDPYVTRLETSIRSTLSAVFGEGTAEYRRYSRASNLDNGPISVESSWTTARGGSGGYDDRQLISAQRYLAEGKLQSRALLEQAIQFLEEEIEFARPSVGATGGDISPATKELTRRIFIFHGHDEGSRESVARYLTKIGFEPVILHEQANRGRTIIEKVEANGDVSFAVVLLTPDDEGCKKGENLEPRARQNVLLELGYFIGRLGREHVCALMRSKVSVPSDFAGVVWEDMDDAGAWKQKLARELVAAGHIIDWNVVMS